MIVVVALVALAAVAGGIAFSLPWGELRYQAGYQQGAADTLRTVDQLQADRDRIVLPAAAWLDELDPTLADVDLVDWDQARWLP